MPKIDPKVTPAKLDSESGTALSTDVTLYLDINLENRVTDKAGKRYNMTAVYAPDPSQMGDPVNVLLWFHGHKDGTTASLANKSPNKKHPQLLTKYSIKEYLTVDEYKLREFIAKTSKRKFILVAPTLTDMSGAGLLEKETEAEGFLQQVKNAVNAYTKQTVTAIGDIVLAAHSGGGAIMQKVVKYGGTFARVREVWCDDCTYNRGSGDAFKTWAKGKDNVTNRLWVFSTGSWDKKTTHLKNAKLPEGPDNPQVPDRGGTGDQSKEILDFDATNAKKTTPEKSARIEELITNVRNGKTDNFTYGTAPGHNESIGFYLSELVRTSPTLK